MILDRSPQTASTVLLRQHALAPWRAEYARSTRVTASYSGSLQLALTGEWVPTGAWRAMNAPGRGWRVDCGYGVEPPDCASARAWLAGLSGSRVDWCEAEGFNPRTGALGLRHPWREVVLVWPDGALRYLIVGQQDGPHGTGLLIYDGLGKVHPMGLYVLAKE